MTSSRTTPRLPTLALYATAAMATTLGATAHAATPRENAGVLGGAIVGAAAGGPVGAVAGMIGGALYAHRGERARAGEQLAAQMTEELEAANARLAASTLALEQVEQTLAQRNARVAEQSARIEALAEDQVLLNALQLRVRFATGQADISEDDRETLAIFGRYLERHPELGVRLNGHADSRGSDSLNLALSRDRANAGGAVLSVTSASDARIEVLAHGEREALASPNDHEAMAEERRVDVALVPATDDSARSAAIEPADSQ